MLTLVLAYMSRVAATVWYLTLLTIRHASSILGFTFSCSYQAIPNDTRHAGYRLTQNHWLGQDKSLSSIQQRFMQPQSPPLIQDTVRYTAQLEKSTSTTQYGHADVGSSPLPSSGSSGAGYLDMSPSTIDAGTISPGQDAAAPQVVVQGLSPRLTPLPGSRNRVTEYENASKASTPKRTESLGFEVIKKARKPGDKRAPILDLPNGTYSTCHTALKEVGGTF